MQRQIKSQLERWYPIALGIAVTSFYFALLKDYPFPKSINDVFSTSTTLSGIAIGFLITAKSILFSIDDRYIIKQLKSTKIYQKLINYFMSAIRWSFLLAFISLFCLFIDFNQPRAYLKILFYSWLFSLTVSGASCYRVIDVYAQILRDSSI